MAFAEIAFVDDVAYIVHAPSPEQTIGLVQTILSAFKDQAAKRGLRVNFAEGKTEVLVNLVGAGSRAFKTKLWHDMKGRIPIITETEACVVQAVHQYKHLGSFLQEKAIPAKDRACRVTDARKAAGALVRPFFAKRHISLDTRKLIFCGFGMLSAPLQCPCLGMDDRWWHWEMGIRFERPCPQNVRFF